MLVERGIQVMNFDGVGVAANYLHKAGAIADSAAPDERLVEIIVKLVQRGEFNRIRLANKAISEFEAQPAT